MKRLSIAFALCVFSFSAPVCPQEAPNPSPHKAALDRLASLTSLPVSGWRHHADLPHPEDSSLDDSRWEQLDPGVAWKDGARVLRCAIEIPERVNGYAVRGSRAKLDLVFRSDELIDIFVFSNGTLVSRSDEDMQQPIVLTEDAQPGQRFLVAVRLDALEAPTRLAQSRLLFQPAPSRPDPAMLREEILSAGPIIAAYAGGDAERQTRLDEAVQAIDFSALDRSDQGAFDSSLRAAQARLEALRPWLRQFTIRAAGNSHIDMAWLWPWTETVEVVRNTFRSALDLMREYPDFRFTASSARAYEWMEEKYPGLFKEIQKRVAEGRWEIVGGMWVEPDLNMPAGESLVRQILVGKRYFRDKFGVDVRIGWNPDSFGYNWQLPQIYKKCGMDYFVTQKLLWAKEFTTFPYKLFWWESPDGSRILTYFPHDYAAGIDPEGLAVDVSQWLPSIYGPTAAGHPTLLHLYGVGDHGGGPTRTMLDTATRWMAPGVVFPKLEFSTAEAFFGELDKKLPSMNVPTWKDELYFEYHRGVLTTQAETKRRIRRTEELLLATEKFSALAASYGRTYPREEMQAGWKNLLFDHFHDIMPGSGIAVNYLDAKRNLEEVGRSASSLLQGAFEAILAHAKTDAPGTPIAVFNSLSWPRTEVVEAAVQLPGRAAARVVMVDAQGRPVPTHTLSLDAGTHVARILFEARAPALGFAVYYARTDVAPAPIPAGVQSSATSLENTFVRVTLDPKTGCITSLLDKRTGVEALAPAETDTGGPKDSICGNLLQAFVDKPKRWDAWNIDADFEKEHWDLTSADEVRLVESNPLRAILRVRKHFRNSTFVQEIALTAGGPRVDVRVTADWHEKHILLKVAFPLSAHNDKATFEIPYGSIERPTTRNTPAEQAKFEVAALHWADISDAKRGFSLLNDCKYGYDAKGNVLRLSLLRSPEWPDPHADEGLHEFTYSLYSHPGNWREALTVRRGYELNERLVAFQTRPHAGFPAEGFSVLPALPDDVVVTAFKVAEDGDGSLILRFYESAGRPAEFRIPLVKNWTSAREADLIERPLEGSAPQIRAVTVHMTPYEIKTLRIETSAPKSDNR